MNVSLVLSINSPQVPEIFFIDIIQVAEILLVNPIRVF